MSVRMKTKVIPKSLGKTENIKTSEWIKSKRCYGY